MSRSNHVLRVAIRILLAAVPVYLLLLIPFPDNPLPKGAGRKPFVWNQDDRWSSLERRFKEIQRSGCEGLSKKIDSGFARTEGLLASLSSQHPESDTSVFEAIENGMFDLGPMIAVCPAKLSEYLRLASRIRAMVKRESRTWDMTSLAVRKRMYRLLYGGRAALEEVMLQAPRDAVPPLGPVDNELSQTPSTRILGVTIHSGDILVSRGGAATSALIARGNDFPGNFSHVALVYVDKQTGVASIIESHIERGVSIATLEDYLRDVKLRIMVLRLRADLEGLVADPMIPHKVARLAIEWAQTRHIPYDFTMDFRDTAKMFCSEVVSAPYRRYGITLWMGISSISTPGIVSWLSAFGVTHFETQEPSDLEYDPQLTVVTEWRDPETLYKDHLDNAVIDALLEGAESGEKLSYPWYLLPVGRAFKLYSIGLNLFGLIGPVPEGMNPEAALRNITFSSRHAAIKEHVIELAETFRRNEGYTAPYWKLLSFARQAKESLYPFH